MTKKEVRKSVLEEYEDILSVVSLMLELTKKLTLKLMKIKLLEMEADS